MLWKEYIEYLSQNTLPKSIIDNTVNVPQQPIYITPYEQAVLNGFKWNEKVFNTKFKIDKKLDETSTEIHNTIDTKIHEIKQKIVDQTQNTQSTIQKIEEDLWQFQNIVNKRINDTNDKITKKNEITLWEIKEILPKVNNIIETKTKTITKKIDTIQKDIEWQIKTVDENIQDINNILDITQKNIKKKANSSHKHNISDIDTLDEHISSINKSIDTRATFDEVQTALLSFYTKKETYNKKEVDDIIEDYTTKKGNTVVWRLSPWGSNPMTTLWDIIYWAVTGTQTRLWGNVTTTQKFLSSTWSSWLATAPVWDTVDGTLIHPTTWSTFEIWSVPWSLTGISNTVIWVWSWSSLTTWYNNTIYGNSSGTYLTTWYSNLLFGSWVEIIWSSSTYCTLIWPGNNINSWTSITVIWAWSGNSWLVWQYATIIWGDNSNQTALMYSSTIIGWSTWWSDLYDTVLIGSSNATTTWVWLNACTWVGTYLFQYIVWSLLNTLAIGTESCQYMDGSTSYYNIALGNAIFKEVPTASYSIWIWNWIMWWSLSSMNYCIGAGYNVFNLPENIITNTIAMWYDIGTTASTITDSIIISSLFWSTGLITADNVIVLWLNSGTLAKTRSDIILLWWWCEATWDTTANELCIGWPVNPIYNVYLCWFAMCKYNKNVKVWYFYISKNNHLKKTIDINIVSLRKDQAIDLEMVWVPCIQPFFCYA